MIGSDLVQAMIKDDSVPLPFMLINLFCYFAILLDHDPEIKKMHRL